MPIVHYGYWDLSLACWLACHVYNVENAVWLVTAATCNVVCNFPGRAYVFGRTPVRIHAFIWLETLFGKPIDISFGQCSSNCDLERASWFSDSVQYISRSIEKISHLKRLVKRGEGGTALGSSGLDVHSLCLSGFHALEAFGPRMVHFTVDLGKRI